MTVCEGMTFRSEVHTQNLGDGISRALLVGGRGPALGGGELTGTVGVAASTDAIAGVETGLGSDGPRLRTDSWRMARRAAMGPSQVAEACMMSNEESRPPGASPLEDEAEALRLSGRGWFELGPGAPASSGTILSTIRSIICSMRSSRLVSGGSDFGPGSGALSSLNSWLRQAVPRCLQPMQLISSVLSNWHFIFRLRPIVSYVRLTI